MCWTTRRDDVPPTSNRRKLESALLCVGTVVALLMVSTGCGDFVSISGDDDNADAVDQNARAPDVVVAIDTVAPDSVRAGEVIESQCEYLDPAGNPIDPPSVDQPDHEVMAFPESAYQTNEAGEMVAIRTGPIELVCRSEQLGLLDRQPAVVDVKVGPIQTTVATLDEHTMVAGEQVPVRCEGYDGYGNVTTDAPFEVNTNLDTVQLDVDDDMNVSTTSAGLVNVYCDLDATTYRYGDPLEVLADKPAEMEASLVPDQSVYEVGQVIAIGTAVEDQYGNPVRHPQLALGVPSAGETLGNERFRFDAEGTHTVSVSVDEETHNDVDLSAEFEVAINHTGPDINCLSPHDGEMLQQTGGLTVDVEGSVSDEHGIAEVTVDGDSVTVGSGGDFTSTVQTRHGINFVEITATDELGEQNVRTCAFLASAEYADEYAQIDDAISLQLRQDAIDDKDYGGPSQIDSLNDLILTVLNSDGLENDVEQQIKSDNPYPVDDCDFDVYVEAVYFDGDPHVTAFDLISGGLDLQATFNDIYFDLEVTNGAWYCPGTYNPTVILEYVDIGATAELLLSGGVPLLQLDEVYNVESGEVSAEGGNWFSDVVYDAITSLFQGTFRDVVEDTFEDAISENFDDLFEGLMNNLDVDSLSTNFPVPRLDGNGSINLQFTTGFSHAGATSSRALFGLSGSLTSTDSAAHGINSKGVPHPSGDMLSSPWVDIASGAVHVSLLNQALHSLWRAGLFSTQIGGSAGSSLPDGAGVELETRLPPMVALGSAKQAQLMLGAVEITLNYPDLFDEPVTLQAGATATTDVVVENDTELTFEQVELAELYLSSQDVSIDETTLEVLRSFIGDLLQDTLDQTVNDALPSLPIPSFTIPYSMWNYDLPTGEDLGLVDAEPDHTNTHLQIISEFGIQ